MTKLLWAMFLLFPIAVQAQKSPIKFGDVSTEELKMIRYEKDTSASAVVLVDYGESTMIYTQGVGFSIRFERTKRVKILKKQGYEFANENISLYRSGGTDEKLGSLKGITYNLENGKKVETKLKQDAIFKEKSSDNVTLVKFTLPNVKEGSVIDITYEILSEFIFNFQDWEFQSTIPVVWSEYRTHIPQYFHYNQFMQGYLPVSINEQSVNQRTLPILVGQERQSDLAGSQRAVENVNYQEYSSRWAIQDAPAFKVEPFMNNYRDYFSKINFEIAYTEFPNKPREDYMGTWAGLNKEFLESPSFGGAIKGAGFLDNVTEEITKGVSDPKEKISKIYGFVKENVSWDDNYRKYTSDNLKAILNKKKGNSADINLLLVSMLQRAGINANPLLISTRNHGFVREQVPQSAQFNYVIAAVRLDDKIILLDGTDRTLPINVLPERCLNGMGYLIANDNPGWVNIAPSFKSRTVSNFDLSINEDGGLSGKINISNDGYNAQVSRKKYFKGETEYISELSSAHHWEVQKSTFDNFQKLNEQAKETHEIKIPEYAQKGDGTLYLNPIVMDQITENPFKSETRAYPVDFGSPSEKLLMGKFTIPEGYVVEELPKVKVLGLPKNGGKYTYNVSLTGNTIQFTSQLAINQALFTQEEYPNLKEFYNQVVAKQAEQIVLKKK